MYSLRPTHCVLISCSACPKTIPHFSKYGKLSINDVNIFENEYKFLVISSLFNVSE